ncbi:unnamed protein product [Parnassius apollo]|uniref:(apollo) hypothetical protein n=1 Tax=Parnassius apollo TaxID=110799 RepID=A0A8S3Y4D3_PARAO|nr:unnamed protein product [Parnassius apollo]
MTSHEAIGWMRICRPGSVIGQQQEWLEQLEPWLIKQGNLYRRRTFGDDDKFPKHEYGLYSITEKALKQKPILFSKSPSPLPPIQRHNRIDISLQPRPHASKTRDGENNENEETFLTSCDLTVKPSVPMSRMKGCIINSSAVFENDGLDCQSENLNVPKWKRILFCHSCTNVWNKNDNNKSRRSCGSGDPRSLGWPTTSTFLEKKNTPNHHDCYKKISSEYAPIPTFCTTQGPIVKTVNEARDFLMRAYKENRERQLRSTPGITAKMPLQRPNEHYESIYGITTCNAPSSFVAGESSHSYYRRRLGRSPSPPQARLVAEQSRATNTPPLKLRMLKKDSSKSTIRDALSKLKCAINKKIRLTPPEMGALVTKVLRPIKSFNIENRAHRVISKEKPVPAPKYEANIEDLKRTLEAVPNLDDKLDKKDPALDGRLKDVYVTSHGRPEDDITREKMKQNPNRPLPQERRQVQNYDLGLKEPDTIPYGRTTLRRALEFIESHQMNPSEVTASKIALEYKLKEKDVETILKYFKTYEIYIPETKKSAATFAGPATFRKQLQNTEVKQLEDSKNDKVETRGSNQMKGKV